MHRRESKEDTHQTLTLGGINTEKIERKSERSRWDNWQAQLL